MMTKNGAKTYRYLSFYTDFIDDIKC